MAKIPQKQNLLVQALDMEEIPQEFRTYIGMSGLAGPCKRRIWYGFRWGCDRTVPKRIQRIFDRGDLEEARVVKDLRAVGMIVTDCLDEQVDLVDETGHIQGHPDGKVEKVLGAEKTPHLLEIKTMNNKLFDLYMKKGLAISHPTYWGQIHTYMGARKLTRCLLVVTNKDNEMRSYQRFHYDKSVHDECMSIGMDILTAEFPPKKIGMSTWFECKMCDQRGICHFGEPIKKTCRSCKHVNIEMHGLWSCGNPERIMAAEVDMLVLTPEDQMAACDLYELDEVFE